MIFSKRKHKLPSFPPDAARTFHRLCETLDSETVPQLREELQSAYEQIMDLAIERPLMDTRLVREIYERGLLLLDRYSGLSPQHQALVIGALRYFAATDDSFSDTHFASGFDDDAKVMNYVLEEVGIRNEYIELE
jgi:hypothetical protein